MKMNFKALGILIVLVISAGLNVAMAQQADQEKAKTAGAKIVFASLAHDFGAIKVGDKGEFDLTFKNEGTEPLLLQNVLGCCGTAILDYTKDPILPQKSGSIKLKITTANAGTVSKTITIMSNDPVNATTRVTFKGTIQAIEAK